MAADVDDTLASGNPEFKKLIEKMQKTFDSKKI